MEHVLAPALQAKLDALKSLFENDSRVMGVWLFGSQADGTATEQSDIDLVVLFNSALSLEDELRFETAICDVLQTDDVDVVNLNQANLLLRFRAISGKLLYERDFVRVSDFVEEALIEHRDFYPRAQAILQDFLATLGEEDLKHLQKDRKRVDDFDLVFRDMQRIIKQEQARDAETKESGQF